MPFHCDQLERIIFLGFQFSSHKKKTENKQKKNREIHLALSFYSQLLATAQHYSQSIQRWPELTRLFYTCRNEPSAPSEWSNPDVMWQVAVVFLSCGFFCEFSLKKKKKFFCQFMKLRSGRTIRRDEEVNSVLSVNSTDSISGISGPIHCPDLVRDAYNSRTGTDWQDGRSGVLKDGGVVVNDLPICFS